MAEMTEKQKDALEALKNGNLFRNVASRTRMVKELLFARFEVPFQFLGGAMLHRYLIAPDGATHPVAGRM